MSFSGHKISGHLEFLENSSGVFIIGQPLNAELKLTSVSKSAEAIWIGLSQTQSVATVELAGFDSHHLQKHKQEQKGTSSSAFFKYPSF